MPYMSIGFLFSSHDNYRMLYFGSFNKIMKKKREKKPDSENFCHFTVRLENEWATFVRQIDSVRCNFSCKFVSAQLSVQNETIDQVGRHKEPHESHRLHNTDYTLVKQSKRFVDFWRNFFIGTIAPVCAHIWTIIHSQTFCKSLVG